MDRFHLTGNVFPVRLREEGDRSVDVVEYQERGLSVLIRAPIRQQMVIHISDNKLVVCGREYADRNTKG